MGSEDDYARDLDGLAIMATVMVSAVEVRATSFHADVYHLGGKLTVQRVFPRAWHFRNADGWILTVTTAFYDGPLAIRTNRASLKSLPVEPGMPASIDHDALTIGTLQISLDGAHAWSPRRAEDAPPLSFSALQRDVEALTRLSVARPSVPAPSVARPSSAGRTEFGDPLRSAMGEGPHLGVSRSKSRSTRHDDLRVVAGTEPRATGQSGALWLQCATTHIETLLDALVHMDERAIQASVLGLLGLGPGLTPAGDDLLCGLLVGLQVFGRRAPRLGEWATQSAAMVARVTERAAPERTTALSRTLLHYAARSVVIDPLLDVVCTLGSGDPASQGYTQWTTQAGSARGATQAGSARRVPGLDELRVIGHSSGSDMLAGALLAARAVLEQEKMVGSALVYPA